jgi:hypothetical protein
MILHAASIAAFFAQQTQQAQCVVQCTSSPTDSWKKWLPAFVQTIVSLVSIGAGVWIAAWSFSKNRQSEHEQWVRNQRAEHEQWIRDQKKAEWSRLLESVANIYRILYLGKTMNREIEEALKNELKPAIRALSVALANCIFLEEFRPNNEKGKKITDFIKSAYITSNKISMRLELFDSTREKETSSEEDRQEELMGYVNSILNEGFKFADEHSDLLLWIQEEAARDLMS